eukprot:101120-Amphidinium_carterae.1
MFKGLSCLVRGCETMAVPARPPDDWARLEQPLLQTTRGKRHDNIVLVGDDRSKTKVWRIDGVELMLRLLLQILSDPGWTHERGLTVHDVKLHLMVKSLLGLPPWLRARAAGLPRNWSP